MHPRMISWVVLLILISAISGMTQDNGYIAGTVVDSLGAPIVGAVTEIRYGVDYDTTDAQGHYLLGPLTAGLRRLSISSENLVGYFERVYISADETLAVDVMLGVGCAYLPGDVSNNGLLDSLDLAILYRYFRGELPPPRVDCAAPNGPCDIAAPFYAAGDVNGSCTVNGIDLTYLAVFFHDGTRPYFCESCPPASRRAR